MARKAETLIIRGRFGELWAEMVDLLEPYWDEARIFIGGEPIYADLYAQKYAFRAEEQLRARMS